MTIFIAHERFTSKISRLTPKFREIELISIIRAVAVRAVVNCLSSVKEYQDICFYTS